uniref:Lysosomal Pro-X carboxypeptidase n=1 Tax=Lygus hesperus TaxID=30085 RepID=A0A146LSH7_LYGHE
MVSSPAVHLAFLVTLSICIFVTSRQVQVNYAIKTFDVPLDHFSFTTNQTFKIRYLINDTWWEPSSSYSPIFFYTGNEGNIQMFAQNSGLLWELAPAFKALVVFAEHRYYGSSLPFGNLSYSDPKYSGYLSSSQALADFVDLIEYLKQVYPKHEEAPTPVIAFGGSYGGMLAAWIRMKYPGVVNGALAASAPIWQFTNMTRCEAFNQVTTSAYRESGSHRCVEVIKKSWDAINRLAKTDDGMKFLNQTFKPCVPLTNQKGVDSLKEWLTNMYVNIAMVNYPYPSNFLAPLPGHPVKALCNLIEGTDSKDKAIVSAVFKVATFYFNSTGTTKCMDFNSEGTPDLDINGWSYQSCTEMVMPMCDNGDTMFEKSSWDIKQVSDDCFQRFKVRPIVDYVHKMYGGKRISDASNIIFSNGLLDPWSSGGVTNNVSATAVAVILPGGAHHLDLRFSDPLDPPAVRSARKIYRSIFKQWIRDSW